MALQQRPNATCSRAALIGSAHYSNYSDLPSVTAGIEQLYKCVTNPSIVGISSENTSKVIDPSHPSDVLDQVHDAAASATDTLLIYFSGHGLVSDRGKLLIATPTTTNGRWHTAISYDQVRDYVADSPASNKIVILDCCYSARGIDTMSGSDGIADEAYVTGSYVIAASGSNQRAIAPTGAKFTAFTGNFIELLQYGHPDEGQYWTLDRLFYRLRQKLIDQRRPEPQRRSMNQTGTLAIALNTLHGQTSSTSQTTNGTILVQSNNGTPPEVARDTPRLQVPFRVRITAADLDNVTFAKPPVGRRGYDEDEVDQFLKFLSKELRASRLKITANDIRNVAFSKPPIGRRGYDEDEVDHFLDIVEDQVGRRTGEIR